jgi:serine/threonine protein kinase
MGTVFLARRADGAFQRTVAIKIIRAELVSRPDLLVRFKRERQILADLDHPNIARMLDGGITQAGYPYFVMECVRGQPILEYCAERGLSLRERLSLFATACSAVEYAHSHGVIHRDIKPSNILVDRDGLPKLLDFGIAKLTGTGVARDALTKTATVERLMTPDYASPEILRGEPASEASDVYALGVVLYEMLAGDHPYREPGQSSRSLLQRAGSDDFLPPSETKGGILSTLPKELKRDLDLIVMRAIRGSAAERYASVRSLAEDIRRFQAGMPVRRRYRDRAHDLRKSIRRRLKSAATAVGNFVRLRPRLGWTISAIAASTVLLTTPAAYVHFREEQQPPATIRFQIVPSGDTRFVNPALSPDGRTLAFVGMQTYGSDRVWTRPLDRLEPKPLPGTEGIRGVPIWSPDSRFLAFATAGKLKTIDVSGGPPQTVCDTPHAIAGGVWSADGQIIFGGLGGGLSQADIQGRCSVLTTLSAVRQETMHGFPVLLPDNKHVLYVIRGAPEHSGIYLGTRDDKAGRGVPRLLAGGEWISYLPARSGKMGRLLIVRDRSLFLQAFDEAKLQLSGSATLITAGLAHVLNPASISANGVLVYQDASGPRQLVWMDRQGDVISKVSTPGPYNRLALSPEGTRLAVELGDDLSPSDVWLMDLERGVRERFTSEPHIDLDPLWRPDGAGIIFASNRAGPFDIFQKPASGATNEQPLFQSGANKYPVDISRDGRWVLYTQVGRSTGDDLWMYPLAGGSPSVFAATEFAERLGVFSPDGRAVAYISDESGRFEVYVRRFPASPDEGKRVVSTGGGTQARWSPDGRELYFIAPDGTLMQADVNLSPEFRASRPKPLFQTGIWKAGGATNGHRWDIAPDGRRFLINTATDPISQNFTVVLNWPATLRE